jgi:hypothetical protein
MTPTVAHMKVLKRAERMPFPRYLALWAWTVVLVPIQVVVFILITPVLLSLLAMMWAIALHAKLTDKYDHHT